MEPNINKSSVTNNHFLLYAQDIFHQILSKKLSTVTPTKLDYPHFGYIHVKGDHNQLIKALDIRFQDQTFKIRPVFIIHETNFQEIPISTYIHVIFGQCHSKLP